ncbi:hypothetical protein LIER_04937 [Lithospermum erythrorhizon]|uniref:Uncharacterized protein n=1 Tax=Lithospermum erythrorhizon TaxID=34254 RepID=A0AAV3P3B5_LITER
MIGERRPLFPKSKVIKKTSEGSRTQLEKDASPGTTTTSTSNTVKRPAPTEERPRLLRDQNELTPLICPRTYPLLLLLPNLKRLLRVPTQIPSFKRGLRPFKLLDLWFWSGSRRTLTSSVDRYLIKLKTANALDDARAAACEKERAFQLQVKEFKEDNEKLKDAADLATKEKREAQTQTLVQLLQDQAKRKPLEAEQKVKDAEEALPRTIERVICDYQRFEDFRMELGNEAAYCLCRFTKTYKDNNPAIVANYEDFIQGYDQACFAPLNLSAPLTPDEEE